jgi:hypothetical protein
MYTLKRRQWTHKDFADGEGAGLFLVALSKCFFEYGSQNEEKRRITLEKGAYTRAHATSIFPSHLHVCTHIGSIVFFDPQLLHNGAFYTTKGVRLNNMYLRVHMYLHWRGHADTDNTRSVHFKNVSYCVFVATAD